MKKTLICLLSGYLLSGCVYYADLHSESHPIAISARIHAPTEAPRPASADWWYRLKNPQLNQLISLALSHSPTLQTAEARVRKAEHLSDGAAASRWPSLDFSGYAQRQRFSELGLAPPPYNGRTFNIGTLGFNFNYEFDFWGKNRQTFLASLSEKNAVWAEYAETRLILSAAVATTYFSLLDDLQQIKFAKAIWQLAKERADIAKTREKHGIESAIPVKSLIANTEVARQALQQWQQAAALTRHQLAILLGDHPLTKVVTLAATVHPPVSINLPASLPANLLANRPDIYAARYRTEAAASRVNVAKARFFPDINLSALFSYQGVGPGFNHLLNVGNQNNAVTAAFDLPIFDAGARRANLGASYADYDMAVTTYNQTILTALQQVADALTILQTLRDQQHSQNIAVSAASQQYNLYHSRYNNGISDYATLIESKQLLLQQQALQQSLQTRRLQATVTMLKALGGRDTLGKDG